MIPEVRPQYLGNALVSRMPVALPEPVASRAQSVSRTIAWRWIRGIAREDQNGYAIVAGNGRTVIILFVDGGPVQAAVTRGREVQSAAEALKSISRRGTSDFFALTYRLPADTAMALSGLFTRPAVRELLSDPSGDLKDLLSSRLESDFCGAVVLRAMESWAVLVINSAQIIGCYGSDDLRLKHTFDDATALFYGDEVEVSVHPATIDAELQQVIDAGDSGEQRQPGREDVEETEVRMIELLSELEFGVTRAEQEPDNNAQSLAVALVRAYNRAITLAGSGQQRLQESTSTHPVLESHWNADEQRLDTARLIETLEMAGIDEAWLSAADALAIALEVTVEQQLVWLALADEHSSSSLQEALTDLLLQSRGLVRRLRRAARDQKETHRREVLERQRSLARTP